MDEPRMIKCIYCHAVIFFPNLPATKYKNHLHNQHSIVFDWESVIERTLEQQYPSLVFPQLKKEGDNKRRHEEVEERPEGGGKKRKIDEKLIENEYENWINGCVYTCGVCNKSLMETVAFISHIQDEHDLGMYEYCSRYPDPCTIKSHLTCLLCKQQVKFREKYLSEHLTCLHNLTCKEYFCQYLSSSRNEEPECWQGEEQESYSTEDNQLEHKKTDEDTYNHLIVDLPTEIVEEEEPADSFSVSEDNGIKEEDVDDVDDDNDDMDDTAEDVTRFMSCEFSDIEGVVNMSTAENVSVDLTGKLPWYHGCLHECQLCTRQFFERKLLKEHVESLHELVFDAYCGEHGECRTVTNMHECEICGRGLIHAYRSLEHHMKKCHQLTLSQYYEEHGNTIKLPRLKITDTVLIQNYSKNSGASAMGRKRKGGKKAGEDNSWAYQCVFECKICDPAYPFESRRRFFRHITKFHGMKVSEYTTSYGNYILSKVDHVCQICGSVVLWDHHAIYQHLKLSHDNFSTSIYQAQYMTNYSETNKKENQRSAMVGISRGGRPPSSDEWSNECVYECKLCSPTITLNASRKMIKHMKKMHGTSLQGYRKQHGRSLISRSYHVCLLCGSSVLWDKGVLYDHMKRFHDNISLSEYHSLYIENNDNEPEIGGHAWLSRCSFECKACGAEQHFNTQSRYQFTAHLRDVHQHSISSYKMSHGNPMKSKVLHSCQICGEKFLWDNSSMKPHIEKKHKITCEEYKDKYLADYCETAAPKERQFRSPGVAVKDPMNQCEFQCQLCGKYMYSSRDVDRHLKTNHGMKKQQYTANFGAGLSRKVTHSCQLCSNEYLFDKFILFLHVKAAHQISSNEYLSSHIANFKQQDADIHPEDDWPNRCIYGCSYCKKSFHIRKYFDQHLTRQHNVSPTEHKNKDSSYFVRKEYHNCLICAKEVLFDKSSLGTHLVGHNTSLDIYYAQYRQQIEGGGEEPENDSWMYRCKFQCSICVVQFDQRSQTLNHLKKEHNMSLEEYEERHGSAVCKSMLHSCQICQENVFWDKDILEPHIQNHNGLKPETYRRQFMKSYRENEACANAMDENAHWMNKNTFECKMCGKSFNSRGKMGRHITRHHHISERQYSRQYGDSLVSSVYHVCQICGNMVLWDYLAIACHLRDKHKTKLGDYKERHMENYSENPTLGGTEKERRKSLSKAVQKEKGIKKEEVEEEPNEEILEWARGCLFKCNECNETVAGDKEFDKHMKREHNVYLSKNAINHKNHKVFEGFHFCKLCHKNIRWDIDPLNKHLDETHKETIKGYFDMFRDNLKMPKFDNTTSEKALNSESLSKPQTVC